MAVKIVNISPKLKGEWNGLKNALSNAAKPFTGKEIFAIPPGYAYMINSSTSEIERLMLKEPAKTISHSFDMRHGELVHVLTW